VEDNQPADLLAIARDERGDRDVERRVLLLQQVLVYVVDAGRASRGELLAEIRRPQFRELASDGVFARVPGELLELRVPALDAILQIDGEDSDVDGFDDIFAEFLETLVF